MIFDEHYSIPMEQCMLDEYSLRFAAFGIDADERNISAGVAELKLSDLDLTIRPFNAWLYLQDVNKVSPTLRIAHGTSRGRPHIRGDGWREGMQCSDNTGDVCVPLLVV